MDILFENRYYSTDEMISEYVYKVLCKEQIIIGIIFSVIDIIMLMITLPNGRYVLSAVFGVCLLLLLSVAILSPMLAIKQLKNSSKRMHYGKKFETIVTFDDKISLNEGSFSLTLEYSQIQKVHSLKHSYVLMIGKHSGVILSPDHFTVGTFEDFKRFLGERMELGEPHRLD